VCSLDNLQADIADGWLGLRTGNLLLALNCSDVQELFEVEFVPSKVLLSGTFSIAGVKE